MSNAKHTPAPWSVQIFEALDGYEIVSESWDVVSASLRPAAPIRKLADANLIAAAPDMLDALTAIADPTIRTDGVFAQMAIDRFRAIANAAIAKATGGS